MSALKELLQVWTVHPPEWMPFICLLTGKAVRKPMVTRLIESLVLGGISAGIMLYVGHQVLTNEVANIKATQAVTRTEVLAAVERIDQRVSRLQDCIMVRTCTK